MTVIYFRRDFGRYRPSFFRHTSRPQRTASQRGFAKDNIRQPAETMGNRALQRHLRGRHKRDDDAPATDPKMYSKIVADLLKQRRSSSPILQQFAMSTPESAKEREADNLAHSVTSRSPIDRATMKSLQEPPSSLAAEANAQNGLLPKEISRVVGSAGKPLDDITRAHFESRFGVNLENIRIHTDEEAARAAYKIHSRAFTLGNHIVFGKGQCSENNSLQNDLLAHELAHAVSPSHRGIMRAISPDYPQIQSALSYGAFDWVITDAEVQTVLSLLAGLNAQDLADTLAQMRIDGLVAALLDNISNADLIIFLAQQQRASARSHAAALGLATQADMAQAQATEMQSRNAAAAAAVHGPTPTPAQVSAQQTSQVASTSIAPQAATLSPADEILQNAAGIAAVVLFAAWAQNNHPSLNISDANFQVDARAVFNRGQNILAFAGAGDVVVVGKSFTDAVIADPAYALPTVIHELRGHDNYGEYGQPGAEFGLELYDQAAALMPGYTQPSGQGRTSEIDAYAYQETEIYSLMVEVPYFTPVTAAHAHLANVNFDPAPAISNRIGIIKSQFESRVALSLVRGLWVRLRLDPRLDPAALSAFEQGVRNNFTAAEATSILN